MALSTADKKKVKYMVNYYARANSSDDGIAYGDAVGADDTFALSELAAFKAKLIGQVQLDINTYTTIKQNSQKIIDLLNS